MFLRHTKLIFVISSAILASGCTILEKIEIPLINNNDESKEIIIKETVKVTISCDQQNIQTYLDKGWAVVDKESKEVPCSWKTVKATKKCNLKRDKGCAIKVPDILGKQTTYSLTRDKKPDLVDKQ